MSRRLTPSFGNPWENGYIESFNGTLRDELLNMEVSNPPAEARVFTEQWRMHHNTVRPHLSLSKRPPALEVLLSRVPMPRSRPKLTGSLPPPASRRMFAPEIYMATWKPPGHLPRPAASQNRAGRIFGRRPELWQVAHVGRGQRHGR